MMCPSSNRDRLPWWLWLWLWLSVKRWVGAVAHTLPVCNSLYFQIVTCLFVSVCRAMQEDVLLKLSAQGIANTIWAFATIGILNLQLMDAFAERAAHADLQCHLNSQGTYLGKVRNDFKRHAVGVVSGSLLNFDSNCLQESPISLGLLRN